MYTYQLDGSCSINEMIDDLKENVKKESSVKVIFYCPKRADDI